MQQIILGNKIITSKLPAFVMGIVNATPDSFYENSRGGLDLALKLIDEGADIIDIGGESTRPGFNEVSDEEQLKRVIPVIEGIRKKADIPISVDTRSSLVFKAAVEAGADVLNDVSALETDENCLEILKKSGASVILMHGYAKSEEYQTDKNITMQVKQYLMERTVFACAKGIDEKKIIWDAGIGFGKTMEENVLLIKNTDNLSKEKFPLVMALSRKRVISYMNGCSKEERLFGTVTANQFAVQKGAKILRVHDVKETLQMLNIMKYLD